MMAALRSRLLAAFGTETTRWSGLAALSTPSCGVVANSGAPCGVSAGTFAEDADENDGTVGGGAPATAAAEPDDDDAGEELTAGALEAAEDCGTALELDALSDDDDDWLTLRASPPGLAK